mmetsp:Transcript_28018/g.93099  ORF Transcript_28018/g.93099 Transcript_28018/m.93099 type:complete len:210 (+) Transcript_28018:1174-1803(+)
MPHLQQRLREWRIVAAVRMHRQYRLRASRVCRRVDPAERLAHVPDLSAAILGHRSPGFGPRNEVQTPLRGIGAWPQSLHRSVRLLGLRCGHWCRSSPCRDRRAGPPALDLAPRAQPEARVAGPGHVIVPNPGAALGALAWSGRALDLPHRAVCIGEDVHGLEHTNHHGAHQVRGARSPPLTPARDLGAVVGETAATGLAQASKLEARGA